MNRLRTDNGFTELDQSKVTLVGLSTVQGSEVLVMAIVEDDSVVSRYIVSPDHQSTAKTEIKLLLARIMEKL